MSDRDDLTKLVMTLIATTGPIWRNQPVNACPDDDPEGEPRPMRAVPVNDMTGFINGLLEFLAAHDEQVRAAERERCIGAVEHTWPVGSRDVNRSAAISAIRELPAVPAEQKASREPQPGDGPDYHADHAYWASHSAEQKASNSEFEQAAREHAVENLELLNRAQTALGDCGREIAILREQLAETREASNNNKEELTMSNTLTAEDFDLVYDAEHTFPFTESEDATIMAYGHVDPVELAQKITEYDRLASGTDEFETDPGDVLKVWAVVVDADEWRISWNGITSETPGAFPVSVVYR